MSNKGQKSYTIRAAGADRSLQKFLLGKFSAQLPDFRGSGPWRLGKEERAGGEQWGLELVSSSSEKAKSTLDGGKDDVKHTKAKSSRFRGMTERSLAADKPSNFFVLVRQKGVDGFLAIPVNEWATFKSDVPRGEQSLEDAEAAMKFQRLQAQRASNTRLAQAITTSIAGEDENAPSLPGEDDADSDEEWKDIKARAATVIAADKSSAQGTDASLGGADKDSAGARTAGHRSHRAKGMDLEDEDFSLNARKDPRASFYVPRPEDAEDWEHEDEAADDDVDMGDALAEDVDESPIRGRPSPAVSDDEQQGDENQFISKKSNRGPSDVEGVKRAIKKMMKSTGMADSDSDDREGTEDEEDEFEDEEDLDKMAEEVLPGGTHSKTDSHLPELSDKKDMLTRKRKSPPPSATLKTTAKPSSTETAGIKKARVQNEKAQGSEQKPKGSSPQVQDLPTKEEVAKFIQERKRVLLKDLTGAFSKRLIDMEARKFFSQIVKSVAKLDPNQDPSEKVKYLVPK